MRCKDKVALVTGSSSHGIGRAICLRLAEEGAKVVVNYPDDSQLANAEEVVALVSQAGSAAIAVRADVSCKQEVDVMVATTLEQWGKIDVLVNNAGICPFAQVLDISEAVWDRTLAVNLKGTFLCTQAVAHSMIERGIRGSIIAISSINAYVGGRLQAHYGAAKAGQLNLMKSFALGLTSYGIRCNTVLPGTILTDINRAFLADRQTTDFYTQRIPAGFIGDPLDIANAVLYFASDESRYANGAELLVDGGALINFA